jgi:ferritin-like protein
LDSSAPIDGGEDCAATRRELVARGLALGALAATGSLVAVPGASAAVPSDAELLLPVLGAELLAVFAYRAVLRSELMSEAAQRAAARMLAQERDHVMTFTTALQGLGGTPPQALRSVTAADTVLAAHHIPNSLSRLRTERDCLTVLVRVENVLAGIYYTTISQLDDPHLLELSAQVLASEAQHATVLNLLLRPHDVDRAVPSSYVQ